MPTMYQWQDSNADGRNMVIEVKKEGIKKVKGGAGESSVT